MGAMRADGRWRHREQIAGSARAPRAIPPSRCVPSAPGPSLRDEQAQLHGEERRSRVCLHTVRSRVWRFFRSASHRRSATPPPASIPMAHLLLRLDTNASARLRRLIPFVLQPEGVVTLERRRAHFLARSPAQRPPGRARRLLLRGAPTTARRSSASSRYAASRRQHVSRFRAQPYCIRPPRSRPRHLPSRSLTVVCLSRFSPRRARPLSSAAGT